MLTVLILSAWNALRLGSAVSNWDLLKEFAPRPGPIYIAASALFWTLAGIAIWILIRRRIPLARWLAAAHITGYAAWWWMDRLFLQRSSPNWPFALGLTIFFLAVTAIDIFNRSTTAYFHHPREAHEKTFTDSNSA